MEGTMPQINFLEALDQIWCNLEKEILSFF